MTQMHAHLALNASLDDKCFAFGRMVGGLNYLAQLNSALARANAAPSDIVYPARAALSLACAGNASR